MGCTEEFQEQYAQRLLSIGTTICEEQSINQDKFALDSVDAEMVLGPKAEALVRELNEWLSTQHESLATS